MHAYRPSGRGQEATSSSFLLRKDETHEPSSSSSLTASELRRQRLAAASMSRSLADAPPVMYRPDVDMPQSPFVYESYSRGRCAVAMDDTYLDINHSGTKKRYRSSTLAILVFLAFAGVLIFLDDIYNLPYLLSPTRRQRNLLQGGDDIETFLSWFQQSITDSGYTEEQTRRVLAILKTRWPECVDDNLTSQECKELIDADIDALFTGVDRNITSHVIKVRSIYDENYNLVVIPTSAESGGLVTGIFGDGMVYYHFDWNSTGEEATIEQQLVIPPVNGFIVDGINVNGSIIDEFIAGTATGYIAGGWYKPYYVDTDWGQLKLEMYLPTNKTVNTTAAPRSLGPWDCAGLTGVSCCLMIKHDVRDSDQRNSAIQCWIEEARPSGPLTRRTCEDDITKVCVYEKYDGKVLTVPILAYDKVLNEAVEGGYNISISDPDVFRRGVPWIYFEQQAAEQ